MLAQELFTTLLSIDRPHLLDLWPTSSRVKRLVAENNQKEKSSHIDCSFLGDSCNPEGVINCNNEALSALYQAQNE